MSSGSDGRPRLRAISNEAYVTVLDPASTTLSSAQLRATSNAFTAPPMLTLTASDGCSHKLRLCTTAVCTMLRTPDCWTTRVIASPSATSTIRMSPQKPTLRIAASWGAMSSSTARPPACSTSHAVRLPMRPAPVTSTPPSMAEATAAAGAGSVTQPW